MAYTAKEAAMCAAFSMANWDYEVDSFEEQDRSIEWKEQAGGFVRVAERLGLDQPSSLALIGNERGPLKRMIKKYIFEDTAKSARQFDVLSDLCARITSSAAEMEPFR